LSSEQLAQYDGPLLLLPSGPEAIALLYTFSVFSNTAIQAYQYCFGKY